MNHGEEPRENLERALLEGDGKAPLEEWLAYLLGPGEAGELVRVHGLKLKGFRIEKAPARVLLSTLVKGVLSQARLREELLHRLRRPEPPPAAAPLPESTASPDEAEAVQEALRVQLRELGARATAQEEELRLLRQRLEQVRGRTETAEARAGDAEAHIRELKGRLRKLKERERQGQEAVDRLREQEALEKENERLRTNVATLYGRVASLEQALAEAPGTRPAAPAPAAPGPPAGERTWLPVLAEEFLDTLQEYKEDDVQRIVQAVFLACLNPSRPSLNFKKLAGAGELWSVRAGPSLRLYFRREGRRLRFVALADREEQDEVIRSLRERYA